MTSDPRNPQLFGTQEDVAWLAWSTAFGVITVAPIDASFSPGARLVADRAKFDLWWEQINASPWPDTYTLMVAAWTAGTSAHADAAQQAFNTWWQEILNAQPGTS